MRGIVRIGLGFLLGAAGLAVVPGAAEACSCLQTPAPCTATWQVDAVFVGQAIESGVGPVRFAVERAVRGVETTVVVVGGGPGTCAFSFEAGRRYVVYARRSGEQFVTSICTRTWLADRAADDLAWFDALSNQARRGSMDRSASTVRITSRGIMASRPRSPESP